MFLKMFKELTEKISIREEISNLQFVKLRSSMLTDACLVVLAENCGNIESLHLYGCSNCGVDPTDIGIVCVI